MAIKLELRLLGVPEIQVDGLRAPGPKLKKAQAILYYLATTGQPQTRATLAGLLWGDVPEAAALTSLRTALAGLRESFGPFLNIDRETVALRMGSSVWSDVIDFVGGAKPGTRDIWRLEEAIRLYRGDFLAGFYVQSAPDFEQWTLGQRDRLRELATGALKSLADYHAGEGNLAQAVACTRHWLDLEPWREEAHQELMRLLARDRQRSAALAQYEICRRILAEELAVEPADETTALYEHIRRGTPESSSEEDGPLGPRKHIPVPTSPPAIVTPFVGRRQELEVILRRLEDPACRLLALLGPGGIGKSRLAMEVARLQAERPPERQRFRDGILFVDLTPVGTPGGMIAAIAEAAHFSFYSRVPPRQQLLDYLQDKAMLLVLDNLEHLLAGQDILGDILAAAPGVRILVTSPEVPALREACYHPIEGMAYPADRGVPEVDIAAYDAVRLFMQEARRVHAGFSLAANCEEIVRICRLTEGMPLAIELAAAWLSVLPPGQIAHEIERSLDILRTRQHGIPERHRSVRAVFEHAYRLLRPEERRVFNRLAVFRGGFDWDAAARVAGASLGVLAALIDRSLVRMAPSGRYQMHELLRQFALGELADDPAEQAAARDGHRSYYLDFLAEREPRLRGGDQQRALAEIGNEIGNLRAAWDCALEQGQLDLVARSGDALSEFYLVRCRYQEGEQAFGYAEEIVGATADAGLMGKILARRGAFHAALGQYKSARTYLEKALAASRSGSNDSEVALALAALSEAAGWPGGSGNPEPLLRESVAILRQAGDLDGLARVLCSLAEAHVYMGDYTTAVRLADESLAFSQQIGRPDRIAHALDTLGFAWWCTGEYASAEHYYREALDLFEEIGNQLGVALALGGLGWVAWAQGGPRLPEALPYLERSLALCRHIGHRRHTASRLGMLGQVANGLGQQVAAQKYSFEGLTISMELGLFTFAALSLNALGEAACALADYRSSRRYLLRGLATALEGGLYGQVAQSLVHLATLFAQEASTLMARDSRDAKIRAAELLGTVLADGSCWAVFRDRAASLHARLAAELPPEIMADATLRGRHSTLTETAVAMLQEGAQTT